ncbi:metal ABC transporter substrate-binding protein [Rhizohabitans arisaemae]|uniref:metal ABC transporter substrate-binding protein n=1 Tax=Rhizohabitans arisaemae TaxID=2720610 RepID=UPI0024B1E8B3|nr:metal ABC transporter substrate-binding protein [Rhizohabitans arisaemae]
MKYDFSGFQVRIPVKVAGIFAGLSLMAVTACGGAETGTRQAGAESTDKTEIVASVYPLAWLAERVGGPGAEVTTLTKPGTEPHDLELTPRQAVEMGKADLTFYIRGIQPAVDEAVTDHAKDASFDALTAVTPLTVDGVVDPHLWLDPSRLATVATQLGERLAARDPGHAAGYRERATATAAALTTLDAEFKQGLATCSGRTLVTSHTAFAYLTDRYGLRQVGVSGVDPDSEPNPGRIAEVAEIVKREKVSTIFFETLASPKVAEVVAAETGAKTAVIDPLEGPPAQGDYLTAMRANLTAIKTGLGCS